MTDAVERAFPHLKINPESKGCLGPRDEALYLNECHKALCKLLDQWLFSVSKGACGRFRFRSAQGAIQLVRR